ncbi:unnamed protein product [Dicrocoelium dendriticum]|nr:unnamed protein product [Dicrocoelium dendriticum]
MKLILQTKDCVEIPKFISCTRNSALFDELQRFEVCLLGRGEADAAVSCECTIVFEYTERYPHEKPIYDICNVKGLTSDQVGELHRSLDSVAQRSLGYIMIFDMLSEVQERLNFTCERSASDASQGR